MVRAEQPAKRNHPSEEERVLRAGLRAACMVDVSQLEEAGAMHTVLLGPVFNAAHAVIDGGDRVVVSYNVVAPARAGSNCVAEHRIAIRTFECDMKDDYLAKKTPPPYVSASAIAASEPNRACTHERNFRSNGPEDARLVPVGDARVVATYNDFYTPTTTGNSTRAQFVFSPSSARERPLSSRLVVADATRLEKNWAPFSYRGRLLAHRWLLDDLNWSVCYDLEASTAFDRADAAPLRELLNGTYVSGGTNAVRLNATHYLAVGHTRTGEKPRAYRMFAYLFLAEPPFVIVAATPEFNLRTTKPLQLVNGSLGLLRKREKGKPAPAAIFTRPALLYDLDTASEQLATNRHNIVQFPIGLSLADARTGRPFHYDDHHRKKKHFSSSSESAAAPPPAVLVAKVSWSKHDTNSFISTIRVHALLADVVTFSSSSSSYKNTKAGSHILLRR